MDGISVSSSRKLKKNQSFPIVAIGASSGGMEAATGLFRHLPHQLGMAFIYIQHADPAYDGKPEAIFKQVTQMPVVEAKDKLAIQPDHLYLIPPNRNMILKEGKFHLLLKPKRPQAFLPINQFFINLAENYKEKTIGILLSGNPPDGTLGLKAIKTEGGITFAQDKTARFQGMVKSAISEDAVDLVLPPERIAEELSKLALQQENYHTALELISEKDIQDGDEHLNQLLRIIHRLTGVDFSHYKLSTIKRRIIRRMILLNIDTLEEYLEYLKQHTNQVHQLYQDLLINVTSFFRDEESTDYLKKDILPRILKSKLPGESIRLWVPACSTGQEAYSLAMLIVEVLGEKAAASNVQIFATDLSELAINKARLGIYSQDEVALVVPKRLQLFFNKIDGSYRIIKSIRDMCVFATHNVIKDPPFSKVDLISCSNLMIYLEPVLQKKMLATFHYSINSFGFLVLGKSESIGNSSNLFSQIDKKLKIFVKKKDATSKASFEMNYVLSGKEKEAGSFQRNSFSKGKTDDIDLDESVDQLLMKKFTPACVVVNQDLDIIQFRGSTGAFLEPAPGKASLNLLKMARTGLGFELRNIVHKASKSGKEEKKSWTETGKDTKNREISIEAIPIKNDKDSIEKYFLVIFHEGLPEAASETHLSFSRDKRVKQLEAELTGLREDLRSIVESQEAANEELQSVNEEIVSSNEELQSINEELETSKEELESSNEELITINQELQMRNEQLAETQEYSEAVFTTIRESLLILDKNLRVKNANSCFYKTFGATIEETEGKLIYDLGEKQWDIPILRELLEDIIPRNSMVSDFEVRHTFPQLGEKIMLLNARRLVRKLHSEHLILLAIEDITAFRQASQLIAEREEWFHSMADNSPMMIWHTDLHRKNSFVNKAWLEYRNMSFDEAIGKSWLEAGMHPDDKKRVEKVFNDSFSRRTGFTVTYRLIREDRSYRTILSKGEPNYNHAREFTGYIGSCVEIPEDMKPLS